MRGLIPRLKEIGAQGCREGGLVLAGGFVTPLLWLINKPPSDIEARIGYAPGRLGAGFVLLFLKEQVAGDEFAYAGHSHFSGGRIGHPRLGESRERVETDLARLVSDVAAMRRRQAATIFQLFGSHRIVKLVPIAPEDPRRPDHENYPVGSGIPQFILTVEKLFVAGCVVRGGRKHLGGGADRPLPAGFWIDPHKAQRL